jgi:hypothetical protein
MRRWRDRLPWILWIGTFYLLMLGPYLYVGGAYVTLHDRKLPLPFLALFDAVPLFQRVSHPFRLVMPVQLGLAVLAARALADAPAWLRAAAPALVPAPHAAPAAAFAAARSAGKAGARSARRMVVVAGAAAKPAAAAAAAAPAAAGRP